MNIKSLILPLAATLLNACGPSGSSFSIKGKFEEMAGAEIYIYNLSDENAKLDTINVVNGEFAYNGECEEVTPYMLVFPNAMEQVIFVSPGTAINYEATANDYRNYDADGNEENKLMKKFRTSVSGKSQKEVKQIALDFIKEQPSSIVSVYIYDRYFVQNTSADKNELRKVLDILKEAQPKNGYLLNIGSRLRMKEKNSKDKVVPEFSFEGLNHSTHKLWEGHKKCNTLIVFWASWANGNSDFLWRLRNTKRDYDETDGRIVFISLDTEYYRFESECRTDTTNAIEPYFDGLAFESPVAKAVYIPSLPYYIITDKNHKIITNGDKPEQMITDFKKYIAGSKKEEK